MRFGIHSFIFKRRRPFSGQRLAALLKSWPTPSTDCFTLDDLAIAETNPSQPADAILKPILRSKGFCWLDSEPLRQHIWAHAGRTLVVNAGEWWWASLDEGQLKFKVTYPGVEAEYHMVKRQKWDQLVGDRRQELVFIGGHGMVEEQIIPLLEACLLTDEEYEAFSGRTKALRVPDDDFHVSGLLKNLGASEDEIKALSQKHDEQNGGGRLRRKQDREDTDILRSLGVGSALEEGVGAIEPESTPLPGEVCAATVAEWARQQQQQPLLQENAAPEAETADIAATRAEKRQQQWHRFASAACVAAASRDRAVASLGVPPASENYALGVKQVPFEVVD